MLLFLGWLLLSVAVGVAADTRGRSFGWLALALLISPLIAGVFLFALPNLKPAQEKAFERANSRSCTHCAELIKREASLCRFCGQPVTPIIAAPTMAAPAVPSGLGGAFAFAVVIAVFVAAGWMLTPH